VLCIFCSGIDFVSLQSLFAVSRVYINKLDNKNRYNSAAHCTMSLTFRTTTEYWGVLGHQPFQVSHTTERSISQPGQTGRVQEFDSWLLQTWNT